MQKLYDYSFFILCIFYFSVTTAKAQIRINELAPCVTSGFYDENGNVSDWVELYNTSASTVNLNGYYLSDKNATLTKWGFPAVNVAPGSYLLVYLSGNNTTSPNLHSNFTLDKNEYLFLSNGTIIYDSLKVQPVPFNTSLCKISGAYRYYNTPTPMSANSAIYDTWLISAPVIGTPSGFYPGTVSVTLNHWLSSATIHYTLDGSEPTQSSPLYTSPLLLNRPTTANGISLIPTNPSFTYPLGSYDSVRANNRGWLPPYDTVNKCVVLKTKAFYPGALSSISSSAVYFIDPLVQNRYSVPVTSLIIDTSFLFNADKGIYVFGNSPDANYNNEGDAWEIPVQFHVFDKNGTETVNAWCGARTHGGGGRHSTLKSLKLFFRDNYESKKITGLLFDQYIQKEHSNLLLRGSGHRPDCISKDELSLDLIKKLRLDKAHYYPTILFINNEYWGIHSFREAIDEELLSKKYNINQENITILDPEGQLEAGSASDTLLYLNLENFVNSADMSLPVNYNIVNNQMDIENYIDYYCAEIFLGNGDWPNNNIKFWRNNAIATPSANLPYAFDGRWRWIFYDLDGGFGGTCSGTYPTFNTLAQAVSTASLFGSYTKLFRGLLNNTQFKYSFINRMCDLLNSSFLYEHTTKVKDSTLSVYDGIMQEHVERWRYPSVATNLLDRSVETPSLARWNTMKSEIDFYLQLRPSYQRKHLFNYFSLVDSSTITLNVNDTIRGEIAINSLNVNKNLDGVNANTYPWNGIYFDNIPLKLSAKAYPGYTFLYWLETGNTNSQLTIGLTSDSTFTAVFGIDSTYDSTKFIRINEVCPVNNSWISDEFNEYDDWLELYNLTNDTLDLSGFYLSDDKAVLTKHQIANGIKLNPYGFNLFWCDNQSLQGNAHTNFSLSAAGETVYLTQPNGTTIVDSLTFGSVPANYAYGSYPNGTTNYTYFNYPTPNESNMLTSVNSTNVAPNFLCYPNPSNGTLTLFNGETSALSINVFSVSGKIMLSKTIQPGNTDLNLSALENGIYFLAVDSDNKQFRTKIVLAK